MSRTFYSLPSPYNFVPLAKEVVFPEWGKRVTQDIPFSDGLDGELALKITLETPTFIRNGSGKGKESPEREEFFQEDSSGDYFIPGSSFKGVIRNLVEIAAFGKMQNITDTRYAVRDMNLTQYTQLFTKNLTPTVKAGWLDISTPDWTITPCECARVERKLFSYDFGNRRKSGHEKYEEYYKSIDRSLKASVSISDAKMTGKGLHYREVVDLHGPVAGRFVFTGQPQDCTPEQKQVKHMEFFFYNEKPEERILVDGDPEKLERDEFQKPIRPKQLDFIDIHTEQTRAGDWRSWLKYRTKKTSALYRDFEGRIPVFYLTDETGNLQSFGLAMLFRLAGKCSVGEAARNTNPDHFPKRGEEFKPDFADLIFGYVTPKQSLRGRVQFSHCRALPESISEEPQLEERVLGTPKASFYPGYIRQTPGMMEKDQYKTYLSGDAQLRGWKRYPVLNPMASESSNLKEGSESQITRFRPLPVGVEFTGKVRIHNLRPVELGALVWALTLGNPTYRRHSIGMAKPFGFGIVRVEIVGDSGLPLKEAEQSFRDYMNQHVADWQKSPSLKALIDMSTRYCRDENGNLQLAQTSYDFHYLPNPRDYQLAKGNTQEKIDSLYLEEYRIQQSKPLPVKSIEKKPVNVELDEAKLFLQEAVKIHANQKEMLKQFKKVTAATPEELEFIRRLVSKEAWFKNKFSVFSSDFSAHLKSLEK